ncbi:MAG: cytochrome c oxidase subunit 3 [Planctomycetota bacterium]
MTGSEVLDKPRPRIPPGWPPDEGGGGDDGGGGDGGGHRPPPGGEGPALGRLGTVLVMVSVTVIFLTFLATYLIMRLEAREWPPPGAPALPAGMWVSTAVIALSGFTASRARTRQRGHRHAAFMTWTAVTFALGLLFCAMQATFWGELLQRGLRLSGTEYARNFFTLTALHVAHVIGGLVYLAVCLARGVSGPGRPSRDTVDNCMLYWHFVGGVWFLLFAVLWFF